MTVKYWQSSIPANCDLSPNHELNGTFIDGRTTAGPWGIMCVVCHARYGVGLGTGCGQKYQRQADERYLKVEG